MTSTVSRRADDLTPQEAATVVHAYETGRLHEGHDEAFALALGVFRAARPERPLSIVAAELELLLACAARSGAPYMFCE